MKLFAQRVRLAALSILLLSEAPLGAVAEEPREDIAARKVVEVYFAALNESKLEVIVGLYHTDSVFLPKDAPAVRGIAEITKAYRTLFDRAKLDTQHVYHHVSVSGDIAVVESEGHGTLTFLDSHKAIPSNNKELFVLRKIENKWKIDRYMFNDSQKRAT